MKVALLTNEFPPDIYGGAGIHVQFLSRELRAHCEIEARAFGQPLPSENNRCRFPEPRKAILFPTIF